MLAVSSASSLSVRPMNIIIDTNLIVHNHRLSDVSFCEQNFGLHMSESPFALVHPFGVRPRTSGNVAVVVAEPGVMQTAALNGIGAIAPPPEGEVMVAMAAGPRVREMGTSSAPTSSNVPACAKRRAERPRASPVS